MSSNIELAFGGQLATIRLKGEPVHTVDEDFPSRLQAALASIRSRTDVRALLLFGQQKVFSAGADVRILKRLSDQNFARRWLQIQHAAMQELAEFGLPTVAGVIGAAAGGGMNIALAADYIVAARTSRFVQAFRGVGLATDMGSVTLLRRRVGFHKARQLAYTGEPVSGADGVAIGLVDHVCDAKDVESAAAALATRLASSPLAAFAAMKSGFAEAENAPLASALEIERRYQLSVICHQDFDDATTAFLDKRTPVFRDRPTP
ncbi:enoyl-CoA hydratase/isomerase family protein [Mycolicibacterium goodii]|uniref:enoyl-CoA hydratase/isomerase family protein n=1 Tax=Mycolicibacterium goodii TaxID=134601 RepID=UPI001BDBBE18|nr:enoyl-CoA hydratase/isomerase family protein [Mycolicibacterium goodii]MBU8830708.1 enoyl-CoA hydratase/isomerase family protein [Mycolicibacterium goodii]